MDEKSPKKDIPVKKRSRIKWLLYLTFWLMLIGAFGALAMSQASQYNDLQNELARIQAETERAVYVHETLRQQIDFIGSDAYIEQQAQRLGLVKPNQLILVNIAQ
jgi:cell division protein FtsB